MDYLMHHGVKGMKWGVRRQLKRQAVLTKAAYEADWHAKEHAKASQYFSNSKNKKGSSTNADMKRWESASRNAKKYYESKKSEFANISTGKITRKQVKAAKQWMEHNKSFERADYTDYYDISSKKYKNYLNDLHSMESRYK